jgi:hypothetical protein
MKNFQNFKLFLILLIVPLLFHFNTGISFGHSVGVADIPNRSGEITGVPVHQYIAYQSFLAWGDAPAKSREIWDNISKNPIDSRLDDLCYAQYNVGDGILIGTGEEDQAWNPVFCGGLGIENCEPDTYLLNGVHTVIHEAKMGVKLGDTFGLI